MMAARTRAGRSAPPWSSVAMLTAHSMAMSSSSNTGGGGDEGVGGGRRVDGQPGGGVRPGGCRGGCSASPCSQGRWRGRYQRGRRRSCRTGRRRWVSPWLEMVGGSYGPGFCAFPHTVGGVQRATLLRMATRKDVHRCGSKLDETGCWLVAVDGAGGRGHAQTLPRARERAGEMIVEAGLAAAGSFELVENVVVTASGAAGVGPGTQSPGEGRGGRHRCPAGARRCARHDHRRVCRSLGVRDMADLLGLSFGGGSASCAGAGPGGDAGRRRPRSQVDVVGVIGQRGTTSELNEERPRCHETGGVPFFDSLGRDVWPRGASLIGSTSRDIDCPPSP